MRDSYLSYAIKLIKEGKFLDLFKQIYKFFAIPISHSLNKSFCGPIHGILAVNYDCNQRCKMCDLFNRPLEYKRKNIDKLNTNEMLKIIDDFAYIGTSGIGFTGGEPILRKDIYELIIYAKSRGLFTHMSSNGMEINLDVAKKLINAGLDAISFSLDGATEATHDFIRGVNGSFRKVINAVQSCKKARKELGKGFVIISVCVINGKNIDEVIDLVDVAIEAGVDKVSFSPVHDIGSMKKDRETLNDLRVDKETLDKVAKVVEKLIEIKKKRKIIDNNIAYLKLFRRAFENKDLPFPCYAGYVTIGVDAYGNIFPCFGWMETNHKIGNIRNISLREFWVSNGIKEARKAIKKCRACYWNNQTELTLAFSLKNLFRTR